jgi:hypothetical protein
MVTHSSTSRPVQCLCMAERTGCPVFTDLWSYVLETSHTAMLKLTIMSTKRPVCRHDLFRRYYLCNSTNQQINREVDAIND